MGRRDPGRSPHMEGTLLCSPSWFEVGDKVVKGWTYMFWILFSHALVLCDKKVSRILMHLWDAHAFNYVLWAFGKTHTLLFTFDVKWLILVREIRLTYLSLNYNFGNWFLCEKPPHTNLPLFSIIGWDNQGIGWRVFGWFWDFSHFEPEIVWDPTFMDLVFPLL